MKTIIIEDESYIRKGLIALIETLDMGLHIIGECGTVNEAVTVVNACQPDLVFLDIHLPDGDAFDFLEETQVLNFKVIFITAYDQYALKALKQGAVDYILKPVDIEELEEAVDKAISSITESNRDQIRKVQTQLNSDKLVISLQEGYQVIRFSELKYCQSDKGYTTFYLADGKSYLASKPLKHFEAQLPDSQFVRIHQSCIVNMEFVERYDKSGMVILKNLEEIPVSTRKREDFLSKLLNNPE